MSSSTNYWEIAGIALSIGQMVAHLRMIKRYENKLEDYAADLHNWAYQDEGVYRDFRNEDPLFYDHYRNSPLYDVCDSAVMRASGAGYHSWGKGLRDSMRSTRGYSPLSRVHLNHLIADRSHFTSSAAMGRASILNAERRRRDEHILERWRAIVDAPVGIERYSASGMSQVISSSFKSLQAYAQGFNAAGVQLGTHIGRLTSGKNSREK